jgi:hypothetical protein
MSIRWYSIVIDCHDIVAQGRWWAEVLGWQVAFQAEDELVIVPEYMITRDGRLTPEEEGPGLVFVPVPEGKTVKNRLHIDVAPRASDDQAAEVDRLIGLGATRVDVGQGDRPWVVLADPEGNEFCVLSSRD